MLNDKLYRLLCKQFGEANIKVVRQGQKLKGFYEDYWDESGSRRTKLKRKESGEEYHLNCLYCRDTRHRLSLSYLFGQKDPRTGSNNIWATNCWNSNCMSEFTNRVDLYDRIYKGVQYNEDEDGRIDTSGTAEKKLPRMPGTLWRLDKLAQSMPRHDAVVYVQDRLMCPSYLGERFGVGYCPDPKVLAAENRLIAPVTFRDKFCGWTGRYIGESDDKRIPKWFHDPGMTKSELFYNFDVASKLSTKILVEGAGDVWGVGDPGLGMLGNKVTDVQMQLLRECCGAGSVLVLLLDPAQGTKDIEMGKKHHMEIAYEKIRSDSRLRDCVVKVYMSTDLDPGDADRSYQYRLIRHVAAAAGLRAELPEN
jgi:hypothetical protein